ncbi:hypothetical protein PR202_ga17650 [Eleusine coracana subsp. coracana]|uniref:Uncharacterized protein n=1 Tax=Eleusine coracana subsp. coracana TaxID=191504 RepID=A0AAV5CQT1_ELECO|nr:hypothetical protein PR202_ga17403 [Eleusine coracana subsp. coracana]GJN00466.1 hypothetical protein PR202_ga17650 [Eleusine coracana subsp. coracana]
MRFEVEAYNDNCHFIAEQHSLLQLEKRASRSAQFYFTSSGCHRYIPHINHVDDLSKTNPFECGSACVR